jgi:hypothetical protein
LTATGTQDKMAFVRRGLRADEHRSQGPVVREKQSPPGLSSSDNRRRTLASAFMAGGWDGTVRDYAKIKTRIWNDEKFKAFSDDGQLVFLFLLSHPFQSSLGAFRHTIEGLAEEKGWTLERFSKGFAEPYRKGMVEYDPGGPLIWLPKHLKHNPPENPNVVISWRDAFSHLPECPLRTKVYVEAERVCQTLPKGYGESFRKGMPNIEPEPEPEPEPKQQGGANGAAVAAPPAVAVQEFTISWNALGEPFKPIAQWTHSRQKLFGARAADAWWRGHWREGLERMKRGEFCRGNNDRGWIADVGFFLKPDSLAKILEGKYDVGGNGKGRQGSGQSFGYSEEYRAKHGDKFKGR